MMSGASNLSWPTMLQRLNTMTAEDVGGQGYSVDSTHRSHRGANVASWLGLAAHSGLIGSADARSAG
jgi:hypothetical protein